MKRYVFCLIFILVLLVGCTIPMNMNTVVKEPNFSGIVKEKEERSILVQVNEEDVTGSDLINVSLDVELKDSTIDSNIGDEIRVYYDGNIAESYPAQVNKVYAIILINPADSTKTTELVPTEYETVNDFDEVTITVKEGTVTPTGLTLILKNKSNNQIIYGDSFLLEQKINDKWYQVPIIIEGDYGFTDIGYELNPGKNGEWKTDWNWLYSSLETGDYRIIKDIVDFRKTGNYDNYYLAAEFEINMGNN